MSIEVHAPSLLVVSLGLAVFALISSYFVAPPNNMCIAFGMALMAYVVTALGTLVKI